jgi:type II secretory pathway pseudopilin PulG
MNGSTRQKGKCGFTLVEVLVASGIFILTLGIIYAMHIAGLEIWETGRTQAELQAKARVALDYMVSELRNATRTSAQVPSPNLSIPPAPNNNQITFYLLTGTGSQKTWDTSNPIQYRYLPDQGLIRRSDNSGQRILAQGVAGIQFFDINIDPLLSIDEVRIVLSLAKTTLRRRDISITLSSLAALRN